MPRLSVGRQFRLLLDHAIGYSRENVIVHDHAVWLPSNHAVASYCRERSITRVVSPRGTLGKWAMDHRRWKKRLAWSAYQYRDLRSASAFHVTSELEADEVRSHGFRQPIAVIPNGITIPESLPARQRSTGYQALFLSRIHRKKGLLNLVRAWKLANPSNEWELAIAGPDECGHRAEVEAEIRRLGLSEQIHFIGELNDEDKWQAYANSNLFVLPSFSENFGIVVAEAMAAGLPVITTTGTPWSVLKERNLGWWVEPTEQSLAVALSEACTADPRRISMQGSLAREYAITHFSWIDVAVRLQAFYESLLATK